MPKYKRRLEVVEMITFDEMKEYSAAQSDPTDFSWNGYTVTYSDSTGVFRVTTYVGEGTFADTDVLVIDKENRLYVCDADSFHILYEKLPDTEGTE